MEINLKKKLRASDRFGAIMSIEKFYQRVIKALSMKTSDAELGSSTAYRISEAHKNDMIEFELQRAKAAAEAHRQRLRFL